MILITRKLLLVLLTFAFTISYSQRPIIKSQGTAASYKTGNFIDVNTSSYPQSAYSITDLIAKVLISGGSDCAGPSVTNVKVSPNTAPNNQNRSWGYFNAGTTKFPYSEGIILSTGYARNAGNQYISNPLSDDIGSQSDSDLTAAINPSQPLTNATYIEFDFVPFVEELTFNFLFASEEYTSTFPCQYSDGFALLLKRQGDTSYTNLAVLPNNAGPVSVTNIIPKPPYSCGPKNAQYFGSHNTQNIETNFNGRVVPLKAHAVVTPGVSYHFKMVLADAGDSMYDSAVFIDAGSFNIGVKIQDEGGVDMGSSYTLCGNDTVKLVASTSIPNPVFKWYKDGNLLPGVTGDTYTATTPGKYKVEVYIAGGTCPIGEKELNIKPGHVPVAKDAVLGVCTDQTSAIFNLENAQPKICTESAVIFQYYENQADAYAGNTNFISNPTSYTSASKTLYVRVSNKQSCFAVVKLNLSVQPLPIAPVISAAKTVLCQGESIVLTSNQNTGNLWSTGETTKSITVNKADTYTLKYNNGACDSETASITITKQADINLKITGDLLFCDGGSTTLTSSSPTGNLWSTGETTQSITVNTAGTYTVTVTTENGCLFTKSAIVKKIPPINNNNAALSGCSLSVTYNFNLHLAEPDLTTTLGVTFTYYEKLSDAVAGNSNFITTPEAYVSGAKKIYVRLSDATCFKTSELQLNINPVPATPVISAVKTVLCQGESIVLTSSSPTGNLWSTGETTQNITVNTAKTYTLKYNDGLCDSEAASITITKQPNINLEITGDLLFCDGGNTTLTSSSPAGNLWSTGETTQSITVNTAGTYTVTVTTINGCEFKKSAVVKKIPPIKNNNAALAGCTLSATYKFNLHLAEPDLTTTSGVTFTYYEKLNDAVAGNNNFIATPESYVSGVKKIYVRLSDGTCFKTSELQLNINPVPVTPVISADKTVLCQGGNIVLTSNQDTGNLWSTGETTKSITVTKTGIYTLEYNDGLCDSEAASITITKQPDINLEITGNLVLCDQENSTTVLTSSSPTGNVWSTGETTQSITVSKPGNYSVTVTTEFGCQFKKTVKVTKSNIIIVIKTPEKLTCSRTQVTLDATGSNYQTGDIITWSASNGGHIVSGGDTLTPVVDAVGTYTITIQRGNCTESKSVEVTEDKSLPVISVTSTRLTICEGESTTLKASGGVLYFWEDFPDNNTSNQTVSPTKTTTYTVSGTGTNGCLSLPVNITITVVPAITSTLEPISGKICEGDPITLDAGSGPDYTYLWSTGETSQTITVTHIAEYSVTISNGICSETYTTKVEQAQIPEITEVIYNHPQLTIIATNPDNAVLEYSINDGFTWQTSNVFNNVTKNHLYEISVRTQNTSCMSSVEYFTFNLSNVITPDGDGYNDIIDFSGISGYQNFSAKIYDRYGNEVYKADSKKTYWDGTSGSRKLSTGSYWYVVIWDDPFTKVTNRKTGWIMLNLR